MATGPEHWVSAELLMEQAHDPRNGYDHEVRMEMLAHAQVRATLANAAATMAQTFALIAAHGLGQTPATAAWAGVMAPVNPR